MNSLKGILSRSTAGRTQCTRANRFSGYDARPMKALLFQPGRDIQELDLFDRIQEIGKKEGFTVRAHVDGDLYDTRRSIPVIPGLLSEPRVETGTSGHAWGQDAMMIVNSPDGTETVLGSAHAFSQAHEASARFSLMQGIPFRLIEPVVDFGDLFMTKNSQGANRLIVGQASLQATAERIAQENEGLPFDPERTRDINQLPEADAEKIKTARARYEGRKPLYHYLAKMKIAEAFDVPLREIVTVPVALETRFLNSKIRPLDKGRVLLEDPNLSVQLLNEAIEKMRNPGERLYNLEADMSSSPRRIERREDTAEIRKTLEKAGFEMIPVPGIFKPSRSFHSYINFMDAQPVLKENGDLVYLATDSSNPELNRGFEHALRKAVPEVKSVYFIDGKRDERGLTYASETQQRYQCGIGSRFIERPAALKPAKVPSST